MRTQPLLIPGMEDSAGISEYEVTHFKRNIRTII